MVFSLKNYGYKSGDDKESRQTALLQIAQAPENWNLKQLVKKLQTIQKVAETKLKTGNYGKNTEETIQNVKDDIDYVEGYLMKEFGVGKTKLGRKSTEPKTEEEKREREKLNEVKTERIQKYKIALKKYGFTGLGKSVKKSI